jgi:hypothetical protein
VAEAGEDRGQGGVGGAGLEGGREEKKTLGPLDK